MIVSFADSLTENVWLGKSPKGFPSQILRRTQIKLASLNSAQSIDDMRSPPSNHLEILKGHLTGYYSVRINDQWRLIFRWDQGNAFDVAVIDYH